MTRRKRIPPPSMIDQIFMFLFGRYLTIDAVEYYEQCLKDRYPEDEYKTSFDSNSDLDYDPSDKFK